MNHTYEQVPPETLAGYDTMSVGQHADLKLERTTADGRTLRYWLVRTGREDGSPAAVEVEEFDGSHWVDIGRYGDPREG